MPGALTWDPVPAGGALTTARGAVNPSADGAALTATEVASARALVSGAGIGNTLHTAVSVGDSFATYNNFPISVSAITCSAGVVTVTAASHGAFTGSKVSIIGAADMRANVHQAPVTVLSSTQFTYTAPGLPDGAVANDGATIQAIMLHSQCDNGLACVLQRRTGGAFNFVSNAGCPGRTSTQVLQYWSQRVTPFSAHVIFWDCYYNDLNLGVPTATTLANVQTAIGMANGALMVISSAWPIGAGAAANTAANLQKMVAYNRQLESLCAQYKNVIYWDNYSQFVDQSTGLIANANDLFADGIHPSPQGRYKAVTTLLALLSGYYKSRSFVASGIDNVATDSANPNLARFMPKDATTGGGTGAGVTGSVPATDGVTGSAAAGTAGAANGFTVSGSNVTTAVAWIKTGTDGFKYQAAQYSAFSNTSGQARISLTLTNSDFTPGGNVSISFKGSVGTKNAGSNNTPAGQSLTAITAQLVVTNTDGTYTMYEAKPSTSVAANDQPADLVDYAFVMDGVTIPAGTLSLVRLDLYVSTSSTTAAFQIDMGRVRVTKNA